MALWTPAQITTRLWLDASDASSITIDTGVSVWADKSGNGNNAVQATAASQPSIVSTGLNGLDVFSLDGVDDSLEIASLLGGDATTLFIVFKVDTLLGDKTIVNDGESTPGAPYNHYITNSKIRDWNTNGYSPAFLANEWKILCETIDTAFDTMLYFDSVAGTLGTTATAYRPTRPFRIGAYYAGGGLGWMQGDIAELVLVPEFMLDADRYTMEGYLAWKWGLEGNLPSGHPYKAAAPTVPDSLGLLSVLTQPYDLLSNILISVLKQTWDIQSLVLAVLKQPYAAEFLSVLTQPYSGKEQFTSVLYQYFGDKPEVMNVLKQEYGNKLKVYSILEQTWDLREALLAVLNQKYSLLTNVDPSVLIQKFDIENLNKHSAILRQPYSLFGTISNSPDTASVTIAGVPTHVTSIDYDYSLSQYCGSFQLTLAKESDWLTVEYQQEVITTINGVDHYSIVIDKGDNKSVTNSKYTLECRSKAVLLDFPFATKVSEDFEVTGLASVVVNNLAALEGLSVTWHMKSDPPLTSSTTVSGSSPLSGIKQIVNALGGVVQSHPDGSIHAIPKYPYNTNEYDTATTEVELTTGTDFTVLTTDADKRNGYNKYSVSESVSSDGIRLTTESVSKTTYRVMASKVPWSNETYNLETSELTNVSVEYVGVTNKLIEDEDVEIVEGAGNTQFPYYGDLSYSYPDRVNLGVPTITEAGDVKTATSGESILRVSYTTRYYEWKVVDTDNEKVQFILVKP